MAATSPLEKLEYQITEKTIRIMQISKRGVSFDETLNYSIDGMLLRTQTKYDPRVFKVIAVDSKHLEIIYTYENLLNHPDNFYDILERIDDKQLLVNSEQSKIKQQFELNYRFNAEQKTANFESFFRTKESPQIKCWHNLGKKGFEFHIMKVENDKYLSKTQVSINSANFDQTKTEETLEFKSSGKQDNGLAFFRFDIGENKTLSPTSTTTCEGKVIRKDLNVKVSGSCTGLNSLKFEDSKLTENKQDNTGVAEFNIDCELPYF